VSPGRRVLGAAISLALMGLWVLAQREGPDAALEPIEIVVVRGDTLGRIAERHGVELADLRRWNGLEGDRIEVGQRLAIYVDPGAAAATAPRRSGRRASSAPAPEEGGGGGALRLPPAQPCLDGPQDGGGDGEVEPAFAASRGIDPVALRAATRAFLPTLERCWPAGSSLSGTVETEITVACTGRVARVEVLDAGGLPAEVVACVADTLRYAAFPAHDQPDGYTFAHPIRFSP
jgi:LysM repeat protein